MKKRILVCLTAAMLLAASLTGCGGGSSDVIKIGLTVPLSGDRASEGSYASNAAAIVEQEINDAGGVLGKQIRSKFKILWAPMSARPMLI